MLLEHLDGYEAAQCIAAGGAVLALSAGSCTAYGVALAFVVFLWLAELALPHHAVKARILSPRGTPRPSSQLRKVLADAEVPEIDEPRRFGRHRAKARKGWDWARDHGEL